MSGPDVLHHIGRWAAMERRRREEEHMSGEDLRQKIIDIICEEWPTPD